MGGSSRGPRISWPTTSSGPGWSITAPGRPVRPCTATVLRPWPWPSCTARAGAAYPAFHAAAPESISAVEAGSRRRRRSRPVYTGLPNHRPDRVVGGCGRVACMGARDRRSVVGYEGIRRGVGVHRAHGGRPSLSRHVSYASIGAYGEAGDKPRHDILYAGGELSRLSPQNSTSTNNKAV